MVFKTARLSFEVTSHSMKVFKLILAAIVLIHLSFVPLSQAILGQENHQFASFWSASLSLLLSRQGLPALSLMLNCKWPWCLLLTLPYLYFTVVFAHAAFLSVQFDAVKTVTLKLGLSELMPEKEPMSLVEAKTQFHSKWTRRRLELKRLVSRVVV